MKLIFLGPPGAGKGTQAAGVSAHLGVPHISTGDMFRNAIRNQTPTGLEAKRYLDAGELVPDSVTIAMVRERLATVVDIDVPDERLQSRLTGRRVCGKCQGTFHISKLADEHTCPICGGELYQRADDKPETIATRLNAYHAQTEPLIGYYKGLGQSPAAKGNRLKAVNGDKELPGAHARVLES